MKKLVFVPISVMLMFSACSKEPAKTNDQSATVNSNDVNVSSDSDKVSVSKDGVKATDGDTKVDVSANGSIDVKSDDANVNIKDGSISVSDGSGSGVSIGKDGISVSSGEGNINVDTDLKKYVIDDSKADLIKKGMSYDEMINAVGIKPFNPANLDASKDEVEVSYFNSELDSITINFVDGAIDSIVRE